MATLILSTAGAAVGTALGGPIGGVVGRALGAAAGGAIDGALLGGRAGPRHVEGPRLADVAGLTSTEGDPVPRVYGRARIGGTLIWATRPLEVANTTVERAGSGAKGGGGQKTVRTAYAYFANLAVGLCEGEIACVRRIWADGRELDQTGLTLRVHRGGADQAPDPLVVAKEGAENAPAYRGLAYVVFEGLPLADFGNRIPQFAFEVVRPVNGLAPLVRAIDLIRGRASSGWTPPSSRSISASGGRGPPTATSSRPRPTSSPRSTRSRRSAPTSPASPWWSRGSATTCGRARAGWCRRSRTGARPRPATAGRWRASPARAPP